MHVLTKDYVYEKLQEKILSGTIPFGTRMAENVLSKELGVSRTPVREALNRLVCEGVAEQIPNDGVFLKHPSLKDIEEVYDLRTVLECHAAFRAATHALPIHLEQMENAVRHLDEALHRSDEHRTQEQRWEYLVRQCEIPFHTAIIHAADNARLAAMTANTQMLVNTLVCVQHCEETISDDAIHSTIETHGNIYRHIKSGDGERAAQAMREHMDNGFQTTLRLFELAQRHRRAQNVQQLVLG